MEKFDLGCMNGVRDAVGRCSLVADYGLVQDRPRPEPDSGLSLVTSPR